MFFMKYVALALMACAYAVHGEDSDKGLPGKCLREYIHVINTKGADEERHCERLQDVINCFAGGPDASGKVLDAYRFLFYQEALFVTKLGVCKGHDQQIHFGNLERIVSKSELAHSEGLHSIQDQDKYSWCAWLVHKACIHKYLGKFKHDHDVCLDADAWLSCYREERKKKCSESVILDHFINVLDGEVGRTILNYVNKQRGHENCRNE